MKTSTSPMVAGKDEVTERSEWSRQPAEQVERSARARARHQQRTVAGKGEKRRGTARSIKAEPCRDMEHGTVRSTDEAKQGQPAERRSEVDEDEHVIGRMAGKDEVTERSEWSISSVRTERSGGARARRRRRMVMGKGEVTKRRSEAPNSISYWTCNRTRS